MMQYIAAHREARFQTRFAKIVKAAYSVTFDIFRNFLFFLKSFVKVQLS